MAKRRLAQLTYDALALEGGLFNAEWLAKVAHLEAPLQKPDDYGIPAGLNLRDEIARAWRIAQALWIKFHSSRSVAGDSSAATEKFVASVLEQAFGYSGLARFSALCYVGEREFPISHTLHQVPVLIGAYDEDLDEGQVRYGEAGRRRSAFGLMQEYLNAVDNTLWGLVCNGLKLRLARDNASLTRPAWLEADLERIFTEERFADFSALWLTIHASRFGKSGTAAGECPLEAWRNAGQQAGTRAREELRRGVERALVELGQGFLTEPANAGLRSALVEGTLTSHAYFQELLRVVYRLIFLLTVEERGVLHARGSDIRAQELYDRGYSLRRLRERAARHSARDTHRDLYAALKVNFKGLATGEPRLALPPLGGLFGIEQTPHLDASHLQNRHLLAALWGLAWIARDGAAERVNWRDMGPEELGSVYESLLELVPHITEGAQSFTFVGGEEARGNARKLSGSYYTPDSLVQTLLDTALEPVIAQRRAEHPEDEAAAILSITVIDPAVGSGHFLLAAARRLAAHLARVRAEGQPSATEHRRAVRDVVSHCLFGVDRNPMALELAKIALWLEAMTPEAPLSFLDTHLVLGDALLGVLDPAILVAGVPDDAYKPFAGDDEDVCKRLRKRNRDASKTLEKLSGKGGQQILGFATQTVAGLLAELDRLPDDSLEAIAAKRAAYEVVKAKQQNTGLAEDLLAAAYLTPKQSTTEALVPTSEHVLQALTGQPLNAAVEKSARDVARRDHAFHWRDAFAHVFARGGFDVVLGNPPWEAMSPDAKEFFSTYDAQVRFMSLEEQEAAFARMRSVPAIEEHWNAYCRTLYTHVHFYKTSGRYKLFASGNLGKGDFNVYRMFVETALGITREGGCTAQFVPEGFYKGANAAAIRRHVFETFDLRLLVGFVNRRAYWFPSVHQQFEFCLYVANKGTNTAEFKAAFRVDSADRMKEVLGGGGLAIPVAMVSEFSPDAVAIMEFAAQAEVDTSRKVYERYPKFGEKIDDVPNREYMSEIHMGSDRKLFSESREDIPLIEGRMLDLYDYRAKGYVSGRGRAAVWEDLAFGGERKGIRPQWYVSRDLAPAKTFTRMQQHRIGFCDVVNPATEKCLVAALIPPGVLCGHSVPTVLLDGGRLHDMLLWVGVANSLVMDFIVRKKVRLHVTYTVLDSLPFPRRFDDLGATALAIARRVFALCAVGLEMATLREQAYELFDDPPQVVEGEEARARLMAEINVLVAREVYGLSRTEMLYILDPKNTLGPDTDVETFSVLQRRELREFAEFRTQRLVMEAWNAVEPRIVPRRAIPKRPYVPTGVPCCEEEAWLAGLICDVVAYGGSMPEPTLQRVLTTDPGTTTQPYAVELSQWRAEGRLQRLPLVLKWLRELLGIGATRDLVISAGSDLSEVPGDHRTEALAHALVDAFRAQQQQIHGPAATTPADARIGLRGGDVKRA